MVTGEAVPTEASGGSNGEAPNILFITVDQLRTDAVGAYGRCPAEGVTPTIDRIAAAGTRFTNCYTVSPVCAPARASLMTGRYPHCHGQISNGYMMDPREQFWWEHLESAGYDTAGIGKMHVEPWQDPLRFGHNVRVEGKDFRGEDAYAQFLRERGYPFSRPRFAPGYAEKPFYSTDFIGVLSSGETIDEFIADHAVSYMESRGGTSKPFAAWVSFCNPHHPLDPPTEYYELFRDAPVPPHRYREDERERKPPEQHVHRAWDEIAESERLTAWRAYYACTRLVDDQIGRVLAALEASGEARRTIVVFTADHGEMLFDHGPFDKAFFFYDCVTNVPLVVAAGGSYAGVAGADADAAAGDAAAAAGGANAAAAAAAEPAAAAATGANAATSADAEGAPHAANGPERTLFGDGRPPARVDALCENIDLIPTFLEWAGLQKPLQVQGRSLGALLRGAEERHRSYCVSEHFYIRMVRTATAKLVLYGGKPYGELYDLEADPDELINLFDEPERRSLRAELTELLAHWSIDAAEPRFRQLERPTNKGAYDWVFKDDAEVYGRYFR